MNFEHLDYLPWIVLAFAVFIIILVWLERKFFKIVRLYWFYKRSLFSYLSSLLLCLGLGLLLVSLLDLRGPEEKIKSGVPTERTIILIDTSASMLAEDVKPSRLQKAVLIAKHFARKAAGHQISVVAFAEIQKKIVPFTNDLDLIDARLESVKNLRNQNGSSALSSAIQESIQYFKETGEVRGNILVMTDGEETAADINLKIPKEIHVAMVGIGTTQGGRIPLDDGRGFRFGYKKYKGQDVITKLNESFFKQVTSDIPSGEYWLANTYALPSDEILEFFMGEKGKGEKEQDMVIKPVLMEWVVAPAVLLIILSYLLKSVRIFTLGIMFFILPVRAQEEAKELSPEVIEKMERLHTGELNQVEKLKLADQLQKEGAKEEAVALYDETLPKGHLSKDLPIEAYLNYGTALLEKGEEQKGLAMYDAISSSVDGNSDKGKKIKEMIEKNVVNFFKVQEQKKEQQKKEQKENQDQNKNNKDNKDQNQGSSGSQQDQKNQQGQGQQDQKNQQDNKQDPKDQKNKDQNKGEEKNKDQGEQDKKDEGKENKEGQDDKEKSDQQEGSKKLPPQKIPPKLKQLMSDDRQLQMKIIEQGTRDMNRPQNRKNKDW